MPHSVNVIPQSPRPVRGHSSWRLWFVQWLVLWTCAVCAVGCSSRRVPESFCAEDCRDQWEAECESLCSITQQVLTDAAPEDGGQQDADPGDSGTAGADAEPMTEPCAPGCPTELCDESTGKCASCSGDQDCTRAPYESCSDGACVECVDDSGCGGGLRCQADEQRCVECLANADCEGTGLPRCEANRCAPCQENLDCVDPAAPVCLEGSCGGCSTAADCAHIEGLQACDAERGACVECTAQDNSACCEAGGDACCKDGEPGCERFVCNTIENTCSNVLAGRAEACQSCVSDAHCAEGHRCVMQTFDGPDGASVDVGWACLPEWTGATGCVGLAPLVSRAQLRTTEGATAMVCDLQGTTCQGLNDYGDFIDCAPSGEPDASICGHPDVDDGYCAAVEETTNQTVYRCTYRCVSSAECRAGCSTSQPLFCLFGFETDS